jgi:hypothetical protein
VWVLIHTSNTLLLSSLTTPRTADKSSLCAVAEAAAAAVAVAAAAEAELAAAVAERRHVICHRIR